MPRMTKEQRMQIQEQYIAEQEAMERAEYFPKLVRVLDAACAMGYNLTVQNKEFQLWEDYVWAPLTRLGAKYSRENLEKLEEFERKLRMKQEALAEEARVAKVKQEALAKLTAEERKILGL